MRRGVSGRESKGDRNGKWKPRSGNARQVSQKQTSRRADEQTRRERHRKSAWGWMGIGMRGIRTIPADLGAGKRERDRKVIGEAFNIHSTATRYPLPDFVSVVELSEGGLETLLCSLLQDLKQGTWHVRALHHTQYDCRTGRTQLS